MDTAVSVPQTAAAVAASEERVELALEGMTCAACAARIERALNRVSGTEASVNFATESANVTFDPVQSNPSAMIAAVERAGHHARVHGNARAERHVSEAQQTGQRSPPPGEF